MMGNITGMYPAWDLSVDEVVALFKEVNSVRFGGLFTIEQLKHHPTVIQFTIEGLGDNVAERWHNCFFEFYYAGPRRITSKWAHPHWAEFLYVLVKHEFGVRCGATHNDEDDPVDDPWVSNPSKYSTYASYLDRFGGWGSSIYESTMEGCPPQILAILAPSADEHP